METNYSVKTVAGNEQDRTQEHLISLTFFNLSVCIHVC